MEVREGHAEIPAPCCPIQICCELFLLLVSPHSQEHLHLNAFSVARVFGFPWNFNYRPVLSNFLSVCSILSNGQLEQSWGRHSWWVREMLQGQKSLVAAEHPLGQPVGLTPLSMNIKGLVGSCKRREGFSSPSSLCAGSRADVRQGSGPAVGSSAAPQSDGCPGPSTPLQGWLRALPRGLAGCPALLPACPYQALWFFCRGNMAAPWQIQLVLNIKYFLTASAHLMQS